MKSRSAPLHLAACQGHPHLQVVEVLLRRGAYLRCPNQSGHDAFFKIHTEPTKIDSLTQTFTTPPKPAMASDLQGTQGSRTGAWNGPKPRPEPDGVGKAMSTPWQLSLTHASLLQVTSRPPIPEHGPPVTGALRADEIAVQKPFYPSRF